MSLLNKKQQNKIKGRYFMRKKKAYVLSIFNTIERQVLKHQLVFMDYDSIRQSEYGKYFRTRQNMIDHIRRRCKKNRKRTRSQIDHIFIERISITAPLFVTYNKKK